MSFTITHTVNSDTDDERTYTVEYDYYGGCRGSRDSRGRALEPDDAPEATITAVYDEDDNEVDETEVFTSEDLDEIYSKAVEDAPSSIEDEKAEYMINAYEERDW